MGCRFFCFFSFEAVRYSDEICRIYVAGLPTAVGDNFDLLSRRSSILSDADTIFSSVSCSPCPHIDGLVKLGESGGSSFVADDRSTISA